MNPTNEYHSELVAERAFPESNLYVWERIVPLPDAQQVNAFMVQLELRKHLSAIHRELYQGCQESTYDYLHTFNLVTNM
jgi:hypothetical protein